VAPFSPLVRGWTVPPRAPALAPRVPMVRLSQAAPAEAGAGVRHSLPLLKLLILLHTLEHHTTVALLATCRSPPAAWMRSLGLLARRWGNPTPRARMAAKILGG
jgi:hypothetical protein